MGIVPSVLFVRASTPSPLFPAQRTELESAYGPFVTSYTRAGTEEWRKAAKLAKGGRIVVYRIEHLAKVEHRAPRLRLLADEGIALIVHRLVVESKTATGAYVSSMEMPWPFGSDPDSLRSLAAYTEALLTARNREWGQRSIETRKLVAGKGRHIGRYPKCTCGHPRTNTAPAEEGATEPKDGHEYEGLGRCRVVGCVCVKYVPRTISTDGVSVPH